MKDCEWYLSSFCCMDLDGGRVWDCTAPDRKSRIKSNEDRKQNWIYRCPYPKLFR